MDGTLLRTDVLFESVAALLKRPWSLLVVMMQLLRGRPAMKAAMARHVALDVEQLPANASLVEWLRRQRDGGRRLALYSAANQEVVLRVAKRFGLFEFAQGSDERTNLAGDRKCDAIEARYGTAFSYIGDSRRDLPVWRRCGNAVLVGDVDRLRRSLAGTVTVEQAFPLPRAGVAPWLQSLRIHQWVKNSLVFVPLLLSGQLTAGPVLATALAFLTLGLTASATYVVNDLMDLAADRAHPVKRERPFASGALPIRTGLIAVVLLAAAAAALLPWLSWRFAAVVAIYALVSVAYSMRLKEVPVLDLIVLAFLFTLRIVAGMVAIDAPVSPWLLTFSMFFFFSVASIKRYDELRLLAARDESAVAGRGYTSSDAAFLMTLGLTAGLCSTLVFCIYLVDPASPAHDFARPALMWIICVILAYWLGRAWFLASRGAMHVDPVLFALRDRVSLVLGALILVVSVAARW
jgi:4-hydroxybenzoate polyprenyltransferase/phosphoserine phosphatase